MCFLEESYKKMQNTYFWKRPYMKSESMPLSWLAGNYVLHAWNNTK